MIHPHIELIQAEICTLAEEIVRALLLMPLLRQHWAETDIDTI